MHDTMTKERQQGEVRDEDGWWDCRMITMCDESEDWRRQRETETKEQQQGAQ
jgi:hypothetical protein